MWRRIASLSRGRASTIRSPSGSAIAERSVPGSTARITSLPGLPGPAAEFVRLRARRLVISEASRCLFHLARRRARERHRGAARPATRVGSQSHDLELLLRFGLGLGAGCIAGDEHLGDELLGTRQLDRRFLLAVAVDVGRVAVIVALARVARVAHLAEHDLSRALELVSRLLHLGALREHVADHRVELGVAWTLSAGEFRLRLGAVFLLACH